MEARGVALVTGASRGLGRAIALDLAEAGFEVVATMRNPADGWDLPGIAADQGGALRVARLDVCDPSTIEIPRGLRVLVNNAGTEAEYLPVEHQPMEQWRRIYETNVFGLVEVTRRAIPALRESGGGVVCNVTSSSYLAAVPFYCAYRSSKAAVGAISDGLRAELAPFGIRVVEILPGPIETDMLAGSERMPEAARYPEYRPAAEAMDRARKAVRPHYTPPASAAAAIRRAILDDAAPLRNGCDPLGAGLLDTWRKHSDEELMRKTGGDAASFRREAS
jgi:NAD(P)-dependent dehydrogenase (short-subunit alcohol dehydrogenase family)